MAKTIENALKQYGDILKTQINTPVGQMYIEKVNPTEKIKFDKNLSELLGIEQDLQWIRFVKHMKSPTTYFIHCDLVDKEQNLLNGKPSTVLQTFDITGKPYENVFYQSSPQHIFSSTAPIQSGSVIGYSRSLPYRNVPNQSHASFGLSFRLERLSTRSRSCGTREHRVVRSFFFKYRFHSVV